MKKFALAILLALAGSASAFADGMNQVVSATTVNPRWTVTVFNDTGSAITSGSVVTWDDDDTDLSTSGYPYIVTSTTADDPFTAGVMLTGSCADQTLCEIQVYGPVDVLANDSSDAVAVDTLVGTTTTAGRIGDFTGGNDDTAYLGWALEAGNAVDGSLIKVWVNIGGHHDGTE